MTKNIGGIDRIIRIAIGAALIVWALMGGPIWAWIGIVPLATAIIGWCPPYAILGIKTCKMKQ
ncbi:YgaP family membrane protein [Aliiroseovarius crassostreae]|uniref:YgaP family membrane protein n=1 Tax=Aliiroseovarius crassostreae TaxID=154981 RepID=UPI003C7C895E